jgi:hypothetical protein
MPRGITGDLAIVGRGICTSKRGAIFVLLLAKVVVNHLEKAFLRKKMFFPNPML